MRRILLGTLVLLLALAYTPVATSHAQTTLATFTFFESQPISLNVGASAGVNIGFGVPVGSKVTGVDAVLSYDPTMVQIIPTGFINTSSLFTNNVSRTPSSSTVQFSSTMTQAGTYYSPANSNYIQYAGFTVKTLKAGTSTVKFVCTSGATNDTNIVEYGTGKDIITCGTSANLTITALAPTPTPTPIPPTPTPTPVSTPAIPICLNITKDVAAPVLGQQVRFTCGQISGATSYAFRYRVVESGASGTLAPISSTSNISQPLTISTAGTYDVECQACIGTSCSPYTAW